VQDDEIDMGLFDKAQHEVCTVYIYIYIYKCVCVYMVICMHMCGITCGVYVVYACLSAFQ
jgi:hypothetical protein